MPPASHSWAQERGFVRWAGALVLTLALHGAAVAAGLMRWEQVAPPVAPPAAMMMQLAPLPLAPPAPETQAMPEPRLPEPEQVPRAEPEPEPELQRPVAAAVPIPPIDPVPPSQREPEVVLSKPAPEKSKPEKSKPEKPKIEQADEKPIEKPKEKPKDKPKPTAKPAAETVAAQDSVPQPAQLRAATAAPVQQAAVAAAPSAAETARRASAEANWQGLLLAHLEKHKKYPKSAQRRNQQGTPFLLIRMDRGGKVLSYALKRSSGVEVLDEEVLALVARADPLPPLPLDMPQAVMEVIVPVNFALK